MGDCGTATKYQVSSWSCMNVWNQSLVHLHGLHLYRVHLLERVIKDSGSINCLKAEVFVVEMAYKEGLRCESIRLYIYILQ